MNIDLIIDALELATETSEFERINTLYKQALAAARELQELKPVAWMLPEYGDVLPARQADGTGIYNIPLYTAPQALAKTEQGEMIQIKDGHLSYLKKPWVGLTDDEVFEFLSDGVDGREDINNIEEALRRKNHA